ncbi:Na(+)/H(+) antiporter subunit D [Salidesulfovibrio onnuriiensis]|uniref:Na(+)/H(+) antiporter subunit D n=1 Tax=Salidesulfovibrio onnuriiensis TaxID=2583823 RepID=UPI0011CA5E9E|nr:Na(+)/H(+) antiporter subunit D [Salidesulfovibrio onnuriiensis]
MTATNSLLSHPALFFLGAALLVPFISSRLLKWLLPIPALLAIVSVVTLDTGTTGFAHYIGMDLTFFRVDALSTIFANVFAVQGLIALVFAMHLKDKGQHMSSLAYVGGGFGCVFAGDYLTLFIFWEVMSVASTMLVWLNKNNRSVKAGFRYFLFHTLGGLFLLGGILLRYADLGTMSFVPVDPSGAMYYDWLILLGFCVNAAVVPLHAWLPDAYPEATVTGAVFMSAYTTKTAVYVLARAFAGFEVLAIAGVVMCLYGVFYATMENNARRILGYHIVSQVGYMVAGVGIGTAMTVNGACAHAYAHILYKGLLFMSVGCLLHAAGTAKLTELGGLVRRLPWVFILYVVAGVSISGMPFFNGFVSKTMTIAGAAEAHRTWLALGMELAAVGTFLSVGLKLPYFAFYSKKEYTGELKPIPVNMYVGMGIGAALCIITGLYPDLLYMQLPFREGVAAYSPFVKHVAEAVEHPYVPYTIWHLLQAFMLLGFTGLGFTAMRKILVPHAQRNVDFEYLYILGGKLFLALFSRPFAAVDTVWSSVYRTLGLRGLMGSAWLSSLFDRKGIDTVVDGTATSVRSVGKSATIIQNGRLQAYATAAILAGLGVSALVWLLTS